MKERYKYYEKINQIYDEEDDELCAYLNTNKVISILNQQNKRIKELKEINQQLEQEVNDWKQRFNSSEKWNKTLLQNSATVSELKNDKIKQLKQSQKQFAISELEKLKDFIDHNIEIENDMSALKLQEFYDNQIKKLKGEENE